VNLTGLSEDLLLRNGLLVSLDEAYTDGAVLLSFVEKAVIHGVIRKAADGRHVLITGKNFWPQTRCIKDDSELPTDYISEL